MTVLAATARRSLLNWKRLTAVPAVILSTLVLALAAAPYAQEPSARQTAPAVVNVQTLGPQVGGRIPDFSLLDQSGKARTLRSLMGPKGLMLVLYRSADWCPYCKTQLVELNGRVEALRARGLGVAGVSYDSPATLADFTKRRSIAFPLLSDTGSKTIRALGLLNTTLAQTDPNYGIPFPGTFILDQDGVVRQRYFENAYQERRTVSSMLPIDGPGGRPATQVTTDHLRAVSYASDEIAAPGTIFSLHVDVHPGDRIHVYAPGQHTYRVVSIQLDPSPFLKARPVTYPPSEPYVFAPLNERVPVYQRPFRLVRDVVLESTPAAQQALRDVGTLTITGRLEYQACDDRLCFTPSSAPLTWTVETRALDRERAARPSESAKN